jgi:5-(aminomethyl)-3-furanmethanol phosphate kinase
MWVVKLGGSLAPSSHLKSWIETLSHYACGRAVIVPGGGPFADEVRASQKKFLFDDLSAHRMALLAMEQYGVMLCGMAHNFRPVSTAAEIKKAISQHDVPVWLASTLILADHSIPASWDVSSDSLAAWLASRLGAQALILVKHMESRAQTMTIAELISSGKVDAAFAQFADLTKYQVGIVGIEQYDLIQGALSSNEPCGIQVTR